MSVQRLLMPTCALLVSSVLVGCASTSSDGSAALNQRNWPICSAAGGVLGGGLGAIESSAWAGGGAVAGALVGGLICYAQDGDQDGDGVFDRRDQCSDTPAGSKVFPNGCPYTEDSTPPVVMEAPAVVDDEVIILNDLGDVLFEFDSAVLTGNAEQVLDQVAQRLGGSSLVSVEVIGHTDSRGSDAYNQKLSQKRAQSVVKYLGSHGLDKSKLHASGKGESQPIADNSSDSGRAQNRRVELHVNR